MDMSVLRRGKTGKTTGFYTVGAGTFGVRRQLSVASALEIGPGQGVSRTRLQHTCDFILRLPSQIDCDIQQGVHSCHYICIHPTISP